MEHLFSWLKHWTARKTTSLSLCPRTITKQWVDQRRWHWFYEGWQVSNTLPVASPLMHVTSDSVYEFYKGSVPLTRIRYMEAFRHHSEHSVQWWFTLICESNGTPTFLKRVRVQANSEFWQSTSPPQVWMFAESTCIPQCTVFRLWKGFQRVKEQFAFILAHQQTFSNPPFRGEFLILKTYSIY